MRLWAGKSEPKRASGTFDGAPRAPRTPRPPRAPRSSAGESRPGPFGMIALENLHPRRRGGTGTAAVTRDLTAQPGRGEDLARIAERVRVEGAPDQLHRVQVGGGEHFRHIAGFVQANAVPAGDRPAVLDAGVEDGAGDRLGRLRLARNSVVIKHPRVQVPVV